MVRERAKHANREDYLLDRLDCGYSRFRLADLVFSPQKIVTGDPFIRWDEKAGLRRDAIRSQWSTRSKRNRKETGYEED